MQKLISLISIICLISLLTACGQSGKLYLPLHPLSQSI